MTDWQRTTRHATENERALLDSVFGPGAIDYDAVTINNFGILPTSRAHAPNGNVYFPSNYNDDFNLATLRDRSVFIHEFAHVWQHQSGVNVAVNAIFNRNYDYKELFDEGAAFEDLGVEAQAQVIQDFFLVQNNQRPWRGYPDLTIADYLDVLPEQIADAYYHSDNYLRSVDPRCFLEGTMVDMWPEDIPPDPEGKYDEAEILAKIWQKPIEEVAPQDWVVSYDDDRKLKPGRVTRTFRNRSMHILDIHGLMVTPGHVTYCAPVDGEDNKFAGKHAPIIDILRSDGALMKADGTLVRASTGCEVGSADDEQFWVFLVRKDQDGAERVADKCQLRFGTRWMLPDGSHFSMREYLHGIGVEIVEDGPHRGYARFKETGMVSVFAWTLSDTLPKPETFVLQRSQLTLEDIYEADEWEAVRPQMPVPYAGEAGRSFQVPSSTLYADSASEIATPNIPISMRDSANQPAMSRKQRRSMEAKQRKEAKARATVH